MFIRHHNTFLCKFSLSGENDSSMIPSCTINIIKIASTFIIQSPPRDPRKRRIPSESSLVQLLSNKSHCARRHSLGIRRFCGISGWRLLDKGGANWGIFFCSILHGWNLRRKLPKRGLYKKWWNYISWTKIGSN